MSKNPYKNLLRSMEICYTKSGQCNECIHYDDTKYPECMQELIKDAYVIIVRLQTKFRRANRKVQRLEEDLNEAE